MIPVIAFLFFHFLNIATKNRASITNPDNDKAISIVVVCVSGIIKSNLAIIVLREKSAKAAETKSNLVVFAFLYAMSDSTNNTAANMPLP